VKSLLLPPDDFITLEEPDIPARSATRLGGFAPHGFYQSHLAFVGSGGDLYKGSWPDKVKAIVNARE
jgi:hypothetical protein